MKHHSVTSPFVWVPDTQTTNQLEVLSNTDTAGFPLSGKRLAVKDLFHIAGLVTTAGNPDWAATHAVASHTASAVSELCNAGATLVGKTITDELAYSLNGQNIHYGTPVNPVTPERLPGGSSSGSATAVSAGLADIGLGTDTGGSIRVPASYNGLFGLRPTHGLVNTDGLVALAPGFDTVGVLTRDIATLTASMLCLLKGKPQVALNSPRLCTLDGSISRAQHSELITAWLQSCEFTQVSADETELDALALSEAFRVLQGDEIWQQHGAWITQYKPVFASDIADRFNACATLSGAEIEAAKSVQLRVKHWAAKTINANTVAVIPTTPGCAPLLSTPATALGEYRKQLLNLTAIAGLAGLPQIHLPLFTLNGAPCGLSLIGPANSDLALIDLAQTLLEK